MVWRSANAPSQMYIHIYAKLASLPPPPLIELDNLKSDGYVQLVLLPTSCSDSSVLSMPFFFHLRLSIDPKTPLLSK